MKKLFNPTTVMALTVIMFIYTVFLFISCSTPHNITKSKHKVDLCPSWAPVAWSDNIHNPDNQDYVIETAFNLDVDPQDVTQEQFNSRYN